MNSAFFQLLSVEGLKSGTVEAGRSSIRTPSSAGRTGLLTLLLTTLVSGFIPAGLQAEIIRKAKLKSAITEVVLPAESAEPVTFWAEMNGNSSNIVNFRIEAPQGTRVEFSGAQAAGRRKTKIENIRRGAWYPVLLKERYKEGAKEASGFTLRGPGRSIAADDSAGVTQSSANNSVTPFTLPAAPPGNVRIDYCSMLSPQQIQTMLDQLKQVTGRDWTKEEFCNYIKNPTEEGNVLPPPTAGGTGGNPGGSTGGSTGGGTWPGAGGNSGEPLFPTDPTDETFLANADNASLDLGGVFRKDSCNSRVSKYLVKVTLDFSNVDLTKFPQGIAVRFRGLENVYQGKRAASVKPVSDGKFAPAPLLLMTSVAYNEDVEIIKWTKGKPKQVASVDIEDRVYYRGFVLSRSIASSILTGGTASVDKVSDYQSYGACLSMTRTRQRVNGYPGEGS